MRQVVRGRTTTELEQKVKIRETKGWYRISQNVIDDSMMAYGDMSWVCVMELTKDGREHREWGDGKRGAKTN